MKNDNRLKTKNRTIIFMLLVIACTRVNSIEAQNMAFQKLYCTTEFTIKYFLPMHTGSIFIAGYDTLDFANTNGAAILRKYDKDFNLIWEKKYGGSGGENFNYLYYIGDNRLLVRGNTNSQDGDVLNNYPYGNNEWVCVIDTNGNMLHQLIYGADGSATISNSIKMGPNGNIYFCGSTYGDTFDFVDKGPFDFQDDAYIACADSQLNKKWLKFYEVNNGDSEVRDVDFLPNGHLLLVCGSNVADGDLAVVTPTAKGATVIMEIDSLGAVYWQKRYGAATPLNVDGTMGKIYKDPNKWQYYLSGGTSTKDGDCWDSHPNFGSPDQSYHWIMKIDTLGNKIWSHIYGPFSDSGNTGLTYFTELFDKNTIHFPDVVFGSDNHEFGTAIGKEDTWLVNIDSNGVLYKDYRIGYPNVSWRPMLVMKNPVTNENYYLYNDGKGLGYAPSPNACDTTPNKNNCIIGKYNYWPNNIIEKNKEILNLRVYPNPANEYIVCYYNLVSKSSEAEVFLVSDVTGKQVYKATLKGAQGQHIWDTRNVGNGNYIYTVITSSGEKYSGKVVVQK